PQKGNQFLDYHVAPLLFRGPSLGLLFHLFLHIQRLVCQHDVTQVPLGFKFHQRRFTREPYTPNFPAHPLGDYFLKLSARAASFPTPPFPPKKLPYCPFSDSKVTLKSRP